MKNKACQILLPFLMLILSSCDMGESKYKHDYEYGPSRARMDRLENAKSISTYELDSTRSKNINVDSIHKDIERRLIEAKEAILRERSSQSGE
ncbi:MAG: hypothetical protein MRZ79_09660 [Bacteroidia bacterium]|nr:hypothetical protein [Bacteroidia bacterium]